MDSIEKHDIIFGDVIVRPDRNLCASGKPREVLGHGSNGITWLIDFDDGFLPGVTEQAAFKFIPTGTRPLFDKARDDFVDEILTLKHLRHPGILNLRASGVCSVKMSKTDAWTESSYHVSDFIPHSMSLRAAVAKYGDRLSLDFLTSLMSQTLEALSFCHEHGRLHLDIHPNNMLVVIDSATTGPIQCLRSILIDFGKAKLQRSNLDQHATTMGGRFVEYVHPDLRQYLSSNEVNPTVFSDTNARRFDLFSLSKCFAFVLDAIEKNSSPLRQKDEKTTFDSLTILTNRLENKNRTLEFPLSRAQSCIQNNSSAYRVEQPIMLRLSGEMSVQLPAKMKDLIDSPYFQRLRYVYQLGFTHFVYPSATHSRFSHCIGIAHLASKYSENLMRNSAWFRLICKVEDPLLLTVAALLHDIGHYPFAHYFEELTELKDASFRVPAKEGYAGNSVRLHHEYFGEEILSGRLSWPDWPCLKKTLEKTLGVSDPVAAINAVKDRRVFGEILDGPIDCDKVDYLVRDGVSCGVPYASAIDVNRLLASLTVAVYPSQKGNPDDEHLNLAVTAKGIAPVESILNARYHLFSEVYWHKACRSMAAMLKHAMFEAIRSNAVDQSWINKAVLRLDDMGFLKELYAALCDKGLRGEADALVHRPFLSEQRRLYKRLLNFSAIWDVGDKSAYQFLVNATRGQDYLKVVSLAENVIARVNIEGQRLNENWHNLEKWEILLDIPPAGGKRERYPYVYYAEAIENQEVMPLNEVSGIYGNSNRDRIVTPLTRTQKIRVFVHPDKFEMIRKTWATLAQRRSAFEKIICLAEKPLGP